jgi:tRNA U55 pseudouridine synthase TruB
MTSFADAQDEYYNELETYLQSLAEELGCSVGCAADVWYLRQRSRHTQELEDVLIRLHNNGTPPNICEFP